MENITESAAKTAQKFPWGFIMVLLGGLLGSLSSKYFSKDAQQIKTLQDLVIELRKEKTDEGTGCLIEVALWKNKYLNIVEAAYNQKRLDDSTNRVKLQLPNRQLIEAINKSKSKK